LYAVDHQLDLLSAEVNAANGQHPTAILQRGDAF
jgi:hypothetical protein